MKFFSAVRNKAKAFRLAILAAGLSFLAHPAFAALPTAVAPSTAPASGDWIGLMQGYAKDIGLAIGLIISVAGFLWVSWAAFAKFNEARQGKAEWGEVGLLAGIGGALLIFATYLLGAASGVI